MTPSMWIKALVLAAAFSAGWGVCSMYYKAKNTEYRAEVLQDAVQRRDGTIAKLDKTLKDVVDKSQKAADNAKEHLDSLEQIRNETNTRMDYIANRTKEVSDEITKLGVPKCVYDVNYGSMWQAIGERANTGRDYLFGPKSKPAH